MSRLSTWDLNLNDKNVLSKDPFKTEKTLIQTVIKSLKKKIGIETSINKMHQKYIFTFAGTLDN